MQSPDLHINARGKLQGILPESLTEVPAPDGWGNPGLYNKDSWPRIKDLIPDCFSSPEVCRKILLPLTCHPDGFFIESIPPGQPDGRIKEWAKETSPENENTPEHKQNLIISPGDDNDAH